MSDFFEDAKRTRRDPIYADYVAWRRRPSVVDWFLLSSLVGVLGIGALLLWVSQTAPR